MNQLLGVTGFLSQVKQAADRVTGFTGTCFRCLKTRQEWRRHKMDKMFITMCVIAYNEEKSIRNILDCIKRQNYEHKCMEIVLVDGMSTDRTKDIMLDFAEESGDEFDRIVVLDNPQKTLPSGWNVALREYKGDAIIKVDAHAVIPEDFVSKNVAVLETGEYICGGQRPNIIDEPTPFKQTLLLAESSMFGSSIADYRNNPGKTYVKSLFHAAYRREVFDKVGFFNEELVRTEDNEIHYRMRKAGYKLCFDPDIISYQYTRSSLLGMLKQKYANGFWIGKTSKVCPQCLSIYHFVPFAFVSAIIASFPAITGLGTASAFIGHGNKNTGKFCEILNKIKNIIVVLTTVMWVLYGTLASTMAVVSSVKAGEKRNITNILLPVLFLMLHISYGVGTIMGLMDKDGRG